MAIRARGRENAQYKAKERDEFFRRLDRGGTIRAVAAELGLSVESCYRWRNEAGVSTPRVKSRVYTTEDKAEFFRLLALTGNVSKVAKELGFVRVTCYKWAHQAGIFTGKDTRAQRAQFERCVLTVSAGRTLPDRSGWTSVRRRTGIRASSRFRAGASTLMGASFVIGRRRYWQT